MERRAHYAILFLLAAEMGLKFPVSEALEDNKDHFSSNFDLPCTEFNRGYAYCWCNTLAGWDYCSFAPSRTYEDKLCKSDHTCGKHGKAYSWCYTEDGKWGYCGRVAPKADPKDTASIVSQFTSTYMSCLNECGKYLGKDYFWCYTSTGWDYCPPLPHVTSRNKPCRGDFPCNLHGQAYYWCYTTGSHWDYCGPINDAECGYTKVDFWRSSDHSSEPQLMCRESIDTKTVQTYFVSEPVSAWTDGYTYYQEVALDLIPGWNRSLLTNQSFPVILRSEHLNLSLKGTSIQEKDPYLCYQIQTVDRPSAPIAQVLVPENKKVPDRYIHKAFKESLLRRASIRLAILEY